MSEYIIEAKDRGYYGTGRYIGKLIRCRDCKYTKSDEFLFDTNHCVLLGRAVSEDDYCAWGMRKEVDE